MSRVYVIHPTAATITGASRINPALVLLGTALGVPPSELSFAPVSSTIITRGGMPSAYSYTVLDLLHKGVAVESSRFVIVIGYIPREGFDVILKEGVANAAQHTTSYFTKTFEGLRNSLREALSMALGNIPTPVIQRYRFVGEETAPLEIEFFQMRDANGLPLPLE